MQDFINNSNSNLNKFNSEMLNLCENKDWVINKDSSLISLQFDYDTEKNTWKNGSMFNVEVPNTYIVKGDFVSVIFKHCGIKNGYFVVCELYKSYIREGIFNRCTIHHSSIKRGVYGYCDIIDTNINNDAEEVTLMKNCVIKKCYIHKGVYENCIFDDCIFDEGTLVTEVFGNCVFTNCSIKTDENELKLADNDEVKKTLQRYGNKIF